MLRKDWNVAVLYGKLHTCILCFSSYTYYIFKLLKYIYVYECLLAYENVIFSHFGQIYSSDTHGTMYRL